MERLSLREASARTSLSITTLRRYIRSGRLRAEKQAGRFGPEYFVSEKDLADAGIAVEGEPDARGLPVPAAAAPSAFLEKALRETVPVTLFQELQMKHEQLLVQYGMMRAGGLRVMEMQADVDAARRRSDEAAAEATRLKERLSREGSEIRRRLREAELEMEGLRLENAALREKNRGLEMLTRNAVTNEAIDRRFEEVMEQQRRVDRLVALRDGTPAGWTAPDPSGGPDH